MEDRALYPTGATAAPEPSPLSTEVLVARAHARHQGIPYEAGETGGRAAAGTVATLADLILGGEMNAGEVAYAVAALIDEIEHALGYRGRQLH